MARRVRSKRVYLLVILGLTGVAGIAFLVFAAGSPLKGDSPTDFGVTGWTGATDKSGVFGQSQDGRGVLGRSDNNDGVVGWTAASNKSGVFGHSETGTGVTGRSGNNNAVVGHSRDGRGVSGHSDSNDGVVGRSLAGRGVLGRSDSNDGVVGHSQEGRGVLGRSDNNDGVFGYSQGGKGVSGRSDNSDGVVGWTGASGKSGVFGYSQSGIGVAGRSEGNDGLLGVTTSSNPGHAALRARNEGSGPAIFCEGDLLITAAFRVLKEDATYTKSLAYGPGSTPIPLQWEGRAVPTVTHLEPVQTINKIAGRLINSTGKDGWAKVNNSYITKASTIFITPQNGVFTTGIYVFQDGSFWTWIPKDGRIAFLVMN